MISLCMEQVSLFRHCGFPVLVLSGDRLLLIKALQETGLSPSELANPFTISALLLDAEIGGIFLVTFRPILLMLYGTIPELCNIL